MSPRKKKFKAPSKLAAILDVVVGVGLGLVIAIVWLVLKPVAIVDGPVSRAEGDPPPGPYDLNYQMGPQGGVRQTDYAAKERAFVMKSERGVELTDRDINRWLSSVLGPQDRKLPFPSVASELNLGVPLIRFDTKDAELGVVSDLVLFGNKRRFIMQARGTFQKRGDRFAFVPDKVYLGSCPFPSFLGAEWIYEKVSGVFTLPDEAKDAQSAWNAAKDVVLAETVRQTGSETRMRIGF